MLAVADPIVLDVRSTKAAALPFFYKAVALAIRIARVCGRPARPVFERLNHTAPKSDSHRAGPDWMRGGVVAVSSLDARSAHRLQLRGIGSAQCARGDPVTHFCVGVI